MKKQLKAIQDNVSIQSKNSFQIKSRPSYLSKTKTKHPTLHRNNSRNNRGRFDNNRQGGNNYINRVSRQDQSHNSSNEAISSALINRDE